jgi:hypothetical protein
MGGVVVILIVIVQPVEIGQQRVRAEELPQRPAAQQSRHAALQKDRKIIAVVRGIQIHRLGGKAVGLFLLQPRGLGGLMRRVFSRLLCRIGGGRGVFHLRYALAARPAGGEAFGFVSHPAPFQKDRLLAEFLFLGVQLVAPALHEFLLDMIAVEKLDHRRLDLGRHRQAFDDVLGSNLAILRLMRRGGDQMDEPVQRMQPLGIAAQHHVKRGHAAVEILDIGLGVGGVADHFEPAHVVARHPVVRDQNVARLQIGGRQHHADRDPVILRPARHRLTALGDDAQSDGHLPRHFAGPPSSLRGKSMPPAILSIS